MRSTITSLLALAVAVQAAPTAPAPAPAPASANDTGIVASGESQYSVTAVHNPNFVRNGTKAMLKSYAKYNRKPTKPMPQSFHDALNERLQKRQDGSVPADPTDGGAEYLAPVTIGGQKLNLDLDSGSSDLWVFSSKLSNSERGNHAYFDPSKSSTFKTLDGYTWDISYGDGSSASGTVGTDTVVLGGTTVKGQAVELATTISSEFTSDASDGLLGLAFSSINTVQPQQQHTFFANAGHTLKSDVFAAYLPAGQDGAYDFGYTDSSKYTGSIKYASVDASNGFWQYDSPYYKVGSNTYPQLGYTAISDTGTTLILMGDIAVDTYYAAVPSARYDNDQGGYVFNCNAKLPTLSISIGDTYYAAVPGSALNFGEAGPNECFGGLQSAGSGLETGNMNIYGDIFMNANYAVFSAYGPKFGFAPIAS